MTVADWFASGRVVDLALLALLLEAVLIWALGRRGRAFAAFLPNLLAGACLLLALRAALTGANWPVLAGWLLAALLANLADLRQRWRRSD
jgi:hypothetical protein